MNLIVFLHLYYLMIAIFIENGKVAMNPSVHLVKNIPHSLVPFE